MLTTGSDSLGARGDRARPARGRRPPRGVDDIFATIIIEVSAAAR